MCECRSYLGIDFHGLCELLWRTSLEGELNKLRVYFNMIARTMTLNEHDSSDDISVDQAGGDNVRERQADLRRLQPWRSGISKMRRAEVDEALEELGDPGYLVNDGRNSCYMDSVWVAFFTSSLTRQWVTKHWLKSEHGQQLRDGLRDLYSRVAGVQFSVKGENTYTCKYVRKALAKLPGRRGDDTEWLYTQNDPNDVLQALIHTFHMKPDVICQRITPSGTKRVKWMFNSLMVGIDMLHGKKRVLLKKKLFDLYRETEHTSMVIEDARVLYIPVTRNYLDEEKLTTEVVAPHRVELRSGTVMELIAIIIHHGSRPDSGHYTCCIKRGGEWWHYDDLQKRYKRVKNIKGQGIRENAIGFLYAATSKPSKS